MGVSPHLARAYTLARQHRPHPNPRVGAVIVSTTGDVIGEGAHERPGGPHAEVVALEGLDDAKGATVYVSLEPCSHQGRTPPCADRLIAEGVARVVIGALDPDERVSGAGVARLREAGVEVEVVDDPRAIEVDQAYFHHRRSGRPLVTLKYAMTLDGAVAAADRSSQWITGDSAREDAHRLRAESDAVVVGAGTLESDDPGLDVRLDGYSGPQPRPVIIAGRSPLALERKVWSRDPIVLATREMTIPSGELIVVDGDVVPDPSAAVDALGRAGLLAVMLEGGPSLAGAWWSAGVVDRGVVYIGARVGGGHGIPPLAGVFGTIDEAARVVVESVSTIGADIKVIFNVES